MLPRIIGVYVIMYWLSDGKVMPVVSTVHKMLPAFHLAREVGKFFFAPLDSPFNVTTKGQCRDQRWSSGPSSGHSWRWP
jgi:hypothetical protein